MTRREWTEPRSVRSCSPQNGSTTPFGYGIVAARSLSLKNGIQAVLMPTILFGSPPWTRL